MKKLLLLAMLTILGTTVSNAQETSKKAKKAKTTAAAPALPKVDGAGMVFENETIDYGTVAHNADGNRQFVFTNNGNKP